SSRSSGSGDTLAPVAASAASSPLTTSTCLPATCNSPSIAACSSAAAAGSPSVTSAAMAAIFSSPSPKPSLLTVAASSAHAYDEHDATNQEKPIKSMRIYEEGAARGGPFIVAKSRRYLVMIVLPSGSPFFLSLPAMNGLHGSAFTGPLVFQTTLNWPFACTSPINTALCRWWFFASIVEVMPEGAL